jgi:hypothetical protein
MRDASTKDGSPLRTLWATPRGRSSPTRSVTLIPARVIGGVVALPTRPGRRDLHWSYAVTGHLRPFGYNSTGVGPVFRPVRGRSPDPHRFPW